MVLDYEGRLSIHDPVKKYLPQFSLKDSSIFPDVENFITLEQLLNHTSGISNRGIPGITMGEASLEDELLKINNARLVSIPGQKYEYCNANYRLLGLVIEKVSGKSYGSFINEIIFTPLSMNHSFSDPEEAPNLIDGYGQLFEFPIKRKQRFYQGAVPSGYLISSVSDISIFLMEELRASLGKQSVFPKDLINATFVVPEGIKSNYAKGWLKKVDNNGNIIYTNTGSLENFQSFFYLDPSSNIGFVFMMNQGGLFPMNSISIISDGLIKLTNGNEVIYNANKSTMIVTIILPLVVLLFQCFSFFQLLIWKKNITKRKIWTRISIGLNIFWVIFFLFLLIPLMNVIIGETASLRVWSNTLPELLVIISIIVLSNIIRTAMKIKYLIKQ